MRHPHVLLAMTLAAALVAAAPGCAQRADLLGTFQISANDGGGWDDAAGDGPAVATAPRFAPPQLVAALSDPTADDEDPTFTGDLRELYFSSDRNGTSDIWVSRRASAAEPWGAPSLVPELSSPGIDRSPSVSLDGLAIWFTTDRDTTRGRIWHSSRASTLVPWAAPLPVTELASSSFDTAPSVDATETIMFFSSFRSPFPSYDIYSSTRASVTAPWSAPVRVPGLDTSVDEADPFVAQGGLVVFFTLTRTPMGQGDLYWSARRSTDAPFPTPVPVAGVNSPFPDQDPALSPDLLYLMFASSRSGDFEIYESWSVN
jgi:hypothetical protein